MNIDSAPEMIGYLDRLDRGLEQISRARFTAGLLPQDRRRSPALAARADAVDTHLRRAVRTLTFTGMYNDLAPEHRSHPEVQARLRRILPEMDQAIFGVTASAAALSPAELRRIRTLLRSRPDLGRQLAQGLAGLATDVGVSSRQQQQLTAALERACWQLQRLPTQTLIDEAVERVAKVAERHGQAEELERYLARAAHPESGLESTPRPAPAHGLGTAARHLGASGLAALSGALAWSAGAAAGVAIAVTGSVFLAVCVLFLLPKLKKHAASAAATAAPGRASWSGQPGVAAMSMAAPPEEPPGPAPQADPDSPLPAPWSDAQRVADHRPGQGLIRAGGWLMGIAGGTAVTGGIALLVGESTHAMGTMTAGALLLALGALLLIVGLLIFGSGHIARARGKARAR
ncbi:MAG: hypothetical protein ABI333_22610 [bacterium]